VRDTAWPRDAVDAFLLARLEAKGLRPAASADRLTLLRRLSFDLVGLPPTPQQIEAFERDSRPDAYERVVDRLLGSPHFGERWGRHWLDLVRYAETRGHEFDYPIPNAHHYRDYVLRALNADLPYDAFVREQLAGDLLPSPRLHPAGFNESILGTGFWFLGEELHSPVDVRGDQADRFDNRLDVFGKTFLGLTVACARCHDHKFDAISTRDYYALFGFLASSSYRQVRFDTWQHNREVARELEKLREQQRRPIEKALAAELRPVATRLGDYLLAARESGERRRREQNARKLDAGLVERWAAYRASAVKDAGDPLHAWAAGSGDATKSAGRKMLPPGAQVVVDYTSAGPASWQPDDVTFGPRPRRAGELLVSGEPARPVVQLAERPAAHFDPFWAGLTTAQAENEPGALGQMVRAGRTLRTPGIKVSGGKLYYLVRGSGLVYAAVSDHVMIAGPLHARLVGRLPASNRWRWVGQDLTPYRGLPVHVEFTAADNDFAVAMVVQADQPPSLSGPGPALAKMLREARSPEALAAGYRKLFLEALGALESGKLPGSDEAAERAGLLNWALAHGELFGVGKPNEAVRSILEAQALLAARVQRSSRLAPAMQDGNGVDEHVFVRGSHKSSGPLAPRRFLEALAGPEGLKASGSGRLELAAQVTDPRRNPFLARVMVNRIWHHLFGRGIVASVDDFGVMGQPPTHPELLDYLADRFVRDGWSVKRLVRRLVLSSAYRMSSRRGTEGDRADPENLLLHRMRLRRLEGEAIRDAMLALSGSLDDHLFGPPVGVHLTAFQDGRGRPASGPLDGAGRRSVYLAVRRNFLSPLLLAFDTPAPFSTVGRRTVSNVPAQSLILMNDPFVHQQADRWARRVLAEPGTAEERLTRMYLAAFARRPTAEERAACLDFLSGAKGSTAQGWAELAHALFNVKEFIFLP
jgi:hypothetical protein